MIRRARREQSSLSDDDDSTDEGDDLELQAWREGIYGEMPDMRMPRYYYETRTWILCLRSIAGAVAVVSPFYLVTNHVSNILTSGFEPCSGSGSTSGCTYMRFWGSDDLPGSGFSFVRVMNGVSRPLALSVPGAQPYAVEWQTKKAHFSADDVYFHGDPSTKYALEHQVRSAEEYFDWQRRLSLAIMKLPLCFLVAPLTWMSEHWTDHGGMHLVPSGLCAGVATVSMVNQCEQDDVKERIYNHLRDGSSRWIVISVLVLWCLCLAMHDLMLLSGMFDDDFATPLYVSGVAAFLQGIACVALFTWAVGATEVFPAPLVAEDPSCMCYYQLPSFQAVLALSTPLLLVYDWMRRLRLLAMSCLFGDHVFSAVFIAPHHLVRKTMLWSQGILISPKVVGTMKDPSGSWYDQMMAQSGPNAFDHLSCMLRGLWVLRFIVSIRVGLSAAPFMVRAKELLFSVSQGATGDSSWILRYVAQPFPSIVVIVVGILMVKNLHDRFLRHDVVRVLVRSNDKASPCVRWSLFLVLSGLTVIFTAASAEGLWPEYMYMVDPKEAEPPSLAQAEVWGSAGFVCFILVICVVMMEAFPIDAELFLLSKAGDEKKDSKDSRSSRGSRSFRHDIGDRASSEELSPSSSSSRRKCLQASKDHCEETRVCFY